MKSTKFLSPHGNGAKDEKVKNDIVYVLKQDIDSEELRYSLRSICKNFDFNKVWFYGGCPEWANPDEVVLFDQTGNNKWMKTRSTFRSIFENDQITPDFYLFNDDFYIMWKYYQTIPFTNGTLDMQAYRIRCKNGQESLYTKRLQQTAAILRSHGLDTISYECHVPMLVNREKGILTLDTFTPEATFRSSYGNLFSIGGTIREDSKIVDLDVEPSHTWPILSTVDESFANGKVGEYVRKKFPTPCRFEK